MSHTNLISCSRLSSSPSSLSIIQCCSAMRHERVASSRSLRIWTLSSTDERTLSMTSGSLRSQFPCVSMIEFTFETAITSMSWPKMEAADQPVVQLPLSKISISASSAEFRTPNIHKNSARIKRSYWTRWIQAKNCVGYANSSTTHLKPVMIGQIPYWIYMSDSF